VTRPFAIACVAAASLVLSLAEPAAADEAQAKKLFVSATNKYDKRDFEGALAEYQRAYEAFPRAKILLNIGATYLKLGRKADAANHFARYVGDGRAEKKRVRKIRAELARLDKQVGRLRLDVRVAGGEVQVDGVAVGDSPLSHVMRVEPGSHTVYVTVAQDGWEKTEPVTVAAAETLAVVLVRDAAGNVTSTSAPPTGDDPRAEPTLTQAVEADSAPGRLGIYVRTDVDAKGRGAVVAPGLSLEMTDHIEAFAGALAGGNFGGEIGARVGFGSYSIRPVLTVAAPLFFDDGARPGARGAVGASWSMGRFEASVDVGAAHAFSVPDNHVKTVVLASAGVSMKL
jgi:hypothetical protein